MTWTAGTDEHPEVPEISAFTEGILPPERSADLRSHLTHCLLCTDVLNSLEEIRGLLGTLPGPPRMPEDVAGRIDAALAAEALINATAPDRSPGPATDSTPRWTPGAGGSGATRVSRETSPSPVARPSGHAGGGTGPGRTPRKARRRWAVLTTAGAVAVLGVGGLLVHSMSTDGQGNPSAARPPAKVSAFSGVQLPVQVHKILGAKAPQASPNTGPHAGGNSPFTAKAVPVPTCVLRATGHTGHPLASLQGVYQGHSSYLVVLPHPADVHRVDAYVIDSSCVAAGSTTPGTVLTEQTYSRG